MKISSVLDRVDSWQMALPEFHRGHVWDRDLVRGLFESLYRRHPVGGLDAVFRRYVTTEVLVETAHV
jgi:hypothetical protein